MANQARSKVTIYCHVCGERFTLRGQRGPGGKVDTGFKQCLCDNDRFFEVIEERE